MIKSEEIILSIPEPCKADWNSMTITAKGKHCSRCAKQVIDATNLSHEEIFAVYLKQKGNACMRMRTGMLDVPHLIPTPKWYSSIARYYKKAALFIGMQFLFFNQLKAQVKSVFVADKSSDGVVKKYLKSIRISGTVADSATKEPIPYVKVMVRKNDKIIATTFCKFDGKYILDLKDSIEDNAPASIEFMQTMFDTSTIKEFNFNKPQMVIDTVYLNKSFSLLNEIEISSPKIEREELYSVWMQRNSYTTVGCMVSTNRKVNVYSAKDITKLLQNTPDPSPRQPRLNISGGASELLK